MGRVVARSASEPYGRDEREVPGGVGGALRKLEVPVKRLIQGARTEQVLNPAAVDNPDLIAYFARLGAERKRRSAPHT
ncbi:hypothetical protein GCM10010272_53470 [Streptomyces lateritius]|nr:hypothetical protein GCM10010272_53470 [Streptomyces lateritius]